MKQILKKITQTKFNTLELLLIVIMTLATGVLIGELLFSNNKVLNNENSEIMNVYNKLLKEYYNATTKEKLEEAAINGMIESLGDEYSTYFNEESAEDFNTELNGNFQGIGISIFEDEDGLATVLKVFKNSPADKAGIKEEDKILKINDTSAEGMAIEEISNKIKSFTANFNLTLKRKDKEIEVTLKTSKVEIDSIESKIYEKNNKKIGYIKISIFALNTDEQFTKALENLEKENIDSLIIDLRNNSGGHLDTTVNIASEFLNKEQPVCNIKGKKKIEVITSNKTTNRKINVVILVNGQSASGSEVLASALKEQYGAILVGEKTFGKGTVQKGYQLENGSMIKYTSEEWLTSKGNSINKKGVIPDIEEELNSMYYSTLEETDDNQLQKAIDILKDK